MSPDASRFPWPRWPFYLADAFIVAAAALAFLRGRDAIDVWAVAVLVIGLAAGAFVALVPIGWELLAGRQAAAPPEGTAPTTQDVPGAAAASSRPGPGLAPAGQDPTSSAVADDAVLAQLAALACRIRKRAEQDPETNRVILRHAGKLLELLGSLGIEIISYAGRKIDVGSNVEILDAIDGEYNRVLDESDPQVQRHGRLLRRAVVTIGNGNDASVPAQNPTAKALPAD